MSYFRSHVVIGAFLLLSKPVVDAFVPGTLGRPSASWKTARSPPYRRFGRTSPLSISTNSYTDRNFYAILQVDRKANDAEIKLAYRRLAKLYHPGTSNYRLTEKRPPMRPFGRHFYAHYL